MRRQADDLRAGQICAAIVNSAMVRGTPRKPSDFFPSLKALDKPAGPQELASKIAAIFSIHNAMQPKE